MERRSFLTAFGGAVGGATLGAAGAAEPSPAKENEPSAGLPRRVLGRTGVKVSIVGFSGLALVHGDQPACTAALHKAFDQGVNYFDVAPNYGNGDAEKKMGVGLQGLDRGKYFLACKTQKRDKQGAREELERSLQRLKTDHFDLYQLHALRRPKEDVEKALGPGGTMETILKAKEEGKIRYIGFSAHTTKSALAAMKQFRFDTVMFPINFIEIFTLGYGKAVLELAHEQGAAVVAIKPLCRGAWPEGMKRTRDWWYRPIEDAKERDLALRFTLSQKAVVAGFAPAFLDLVEKAIEAGKSYRPITDDETEQLRKLACECRSLFRAEEEQVAHHEPSRPLYPDSPHEGCPGMV